MPYLASSRRSSAGTAKRCFGAIATTAVAVAVALAAPSAASAQSGFTRSQYSAYVKLGASYFRSNRFFDLGGDLNDRGEDLTLVGVSLYAEFGILDELTVYLNWQMVRVLGFEETTSVTGTGDLRLGLKYGLSFDHRHHIAAMVAPEFPSGNPDAVVFQDSTLASGDVVTREIGLPTGDGEFNVWTRLAYSVSLYEIDSWISTDFGVNWRTRGFAHQLAFGVEFGHLLLEHVYLQARFRGQVVPSSDLRTDVGFIFGEGTEYLSVGAGIAVPIPHTPIGITFDWEQIVAYERNVYAGPLLVFGVSFECGPRSAPDAALCQ